MAPSHRQQRLTVSPDRPQKKSLSGRASVAVSVGEGEGKGKKKSDGSEERGKEREQERSEVKKSDGSE